MMRGETPSRAARSVPDPGRRARDERAAGLMVSYRRALIRRPLPASAKFLLTLRVKRYLAYVFTEFAEGDDSLAEKVTRQRTLASYAATMRASHGTTGDWVAQELSAVEDFHRFLEGEGEAGGT